MSKGDGVKLRTWVLLFAAGGFLLTLVEVRYLHRDKLGDEWQAWIPIAYCAVAAALAFMLSRSRKANLPSAIFFAFGAVIGGYGTWLHSEGKISPFLDLIVPAVVAHANGDEDEGTETKRKEDESAPPVLAPLGIAGLSGFVLAALLVREESNRTNR